MNKRLILLLFPSQHTTEIWRTDAVSSQHPLHDYVLFDIKLPEKDNCIEIS